MFVYIVIFIEDSYIMSLIFGIVKFSFCISTEKVLFKLKYMNIFSMFTIYDRFRLESIKNLSLRNWT